MTVQTLKVRVINCDHPSCSETFELGAGDTAYRARHAAKAAGWSFVGRPAYRDLCPDHAPPRPTRCPDCQFESFGGVLHADYCMVQKGTW